MTQAGRRLLITRPRIDALALASRLHAHDFGTLILPLINIQFLERTLPALRDIQALVFTSANGVRAFAYSLQKANSAESDQFLQLPAFCIGNHTRDQARKFKFANLHSADGNIEALAQYIKNHYAEKKHSAGTGSIMHAAPLQGGKSLAPLLDPIDVQTEFFYKAEVSMQKFPYSIAESLRSGKINGVLLFSPRTSRIFAECCARSGVPSPPPCFCLSRAVAETLPSTYTTTAAKYPRQDSLIESVTKWFHEHTE